MKGQKSDEKKVLQAGFECICACLLARLHGVDPT